MNIDKISDMICRIMNAQVRNKKNVDIHKSKVVNSILEVLVDNGYISSYQDSEINPLFITVNLKDSFSDSVIKVFKRVSKSSRRVYMSVKSINKFYNGLGIHILSTSKGVMSDHDARRNNVGGEVICSIF